LLALSPVLPAYGQEVPVVETKPSPEGAAPPAPIETPAPVVTENKPEEKAGASEEGSGLINTIMEVVENIIPSSEETPIIETGPDAEDETITETEEELTAQETSTENSTSTPTSTTPTEPEEIQKENNLSESDDSDGNSTSTPTSTQEVINEPIDIPIKNEESPIENIAVANSTSSPSSTTTTSTTPTEPEEIQEVVVSEEDLTSPLGEAIRKIVREEIWQETFVQMEAYRSEAEALAKGELRPAAWQMMPKSNKGCLDMPDGGYYCTPQPSKNPEVIKNYSVFAKQDELDSNIYIKEGEEIRKISSDGQDDLYPSKDPLSDTIVWQTLSADKKWQIYSYVSTSSSSAILAPSANNQTNPSAYSGMVVWQEWIGTGWEIVLWQKETGAVRLTDNLTHDMFPSLFGNILTWQRAYKQGWVVVAYDIHKKEELVLGQEGLRSENPRVGILWEQTKEGGEKEYWFYDAAEGTVGRVGDKPEERIPAPQFKKLSEGVAGKPAGQVKESL